MRTLRSLPGITVSTSLPAERSCGCASTRVVV
jgi:hypothetical protein